MQSQGAKVKSSKQQNAKVRPKNAAAPQNSFSFGVWYQVLTDACAVQTQAEIAQLITEITDTVRELEEEQTAALAELEHVEAGSAVYDQSLPPIEEARHVQKESRNVAFFFYV